jgi:hypothetical protein
MGNAFLACCTASSTSIESLSGICAQISPVDGSKLSRYVLDLTKLPPIKFAMTSGFGISLKLIPVFILEMLHNEETKRLTNAEGHTNSNSKKEPRGKKIFCLPDRKIRHGKLFFIDN